MSIEILLRLKEVPDLPVEGDNLNPESLRGKTLGEINDLPLLYGNRTRKVKDFFQVEIGQREKEPAESSPDVIKVLIKGDLSRFKGIGRGMTMGEIEVQGNVGFHSGALMQGGILEIKGSAGDWLGAHMAGGLIRVAGPAGNFIGSAYRGKTQGMTGGTILVKGSSGQMVGSRMRRGLIALAGDCGAHLGYKMLAGTILVCGQAGLRVGVNMVRGTIILFHPQDLGAAFYENSLYQPVFWRLLVKELKRQEFTIPESYENAHWRRFSGDAVTGEKGEVFICPSI